VDTRSKTPDNVVDSLNYFSKPLTKNLQSFFNFHPKQPLSGITFHPMKAYFRKETNLTIKRTWLTYSKSNNLFFCTFCLAFSAEDNRFTIGCLASSSSNLYTRISEHEKSKSHENNFEAFLLNSNMSDINSRFTSGKRY